MDKREQKMIKEEKGKNKYGERYKGQKMNKILWTQHDFTRKMQYI